MRREQKVWTTFEKLWNKDNRVTRKRQNVNLEKACGGLVFRSELPCRSLAQEYARYIESRRIPSHETIIPVWLTPVLLLVSEAWEGSIRGPTMGIGRLFFCYGGGVNDLSGELFWEFRGKDSISSENLYLAYKIDAPLPNWRCIAHSLCKDIWGLLQESGRSIQFGFIEDWGGEQNVKAYVMVDDVPDIVWENAAWSWIPNNVWISPHQVFNEFKRSPEARNLDIIWVRSWTILKRLRFRVYGKSLRSSNHPEK